MSGPHGGTYDGGRAAAASLQRRRLDMAIRDGWHIRYDGGTDEFVASRDEVSAQSLDELLVEMLRAQHGKVGDTDDEEDDGG